jgi:hypothetical protein
MIDLHMQHNQAIFESLFNRNFSDNGNVVFLKELTEKHPYFSVAQFFLLEKMQDDTAAFEKQAVKTNILFNNPHWLNFQLKETGTIVEIVKADNATDFVLPQTKAVEVETIAAETTEISNLHNNSHEPALQEKKIEEHFNIPAVKIADVKIVEESAFVITDVKTTEVAETLEIDDLPDNTDEPAVMEKEIEPMHIELKMPQQNAAMEEAMLFEPMHLVDYFASQGIKLSDEVQTADKLGKQLKSFTEWLKTMKKVHVENEAENPAKNDTNVQALAENSNAEAEVLTESMAEVFARQGKMAKASEVYQKLSLLNPAKSTYFAAKLQNLKGL